jgi:hypothetical protein
VTENEKNFKAMIGQIVSLSGENTLQLALKTDRNSESFATTIKRSLFELFESRECDLQSSHIASTSVKVNGKLSATP